jgi:hypothetical protein
MINETGDWTTCADPECGQWRTCTKAHACLSGARGYEALRMYRLHKFGEATRRGDPIPDHVRVAFEAEGANVHYHYAEAVKEMRGE